MAKKQTVTTDKARYIELELARDIADRRYVLDVSADGDLYCKPCGRILAPARYSNYKAAVNQHLKTANHLKNTAVANGEFAMAVSESGDGYLTPPALPVKKPSRRVVDRSQAKDALVSLVDINVPISQAKDKALSIVTSQSDRSISSTFIRKSVVPLVEQGNFWMLY